MKMLGQFMTQRSKSSDVQRLWTGIQDCIGSPLSNFWGEVDRRDL